MIKWQYKEVTFEHQDYISGLNDLGKDGWEVISTQIIPDPIRMRTQVTVLLKRFVDTEKMLLD